MRDVPNGYVLFYFMANSVPANGKILNVINFSFPRIEPYF